MISQLRRPTLFTVAALCALTAVATTPVSADVAPLAPDCAVSGGNSHGDLIATCSSGQNPGQALYRNGKVVVLPHVADGVTYRITKLGNITDSGWVSGTAEVVSPPVPRGDSALRVVRWTPEGQLQVYPPQKDHYPVGSIVLFGATGDGHVLAKLYYRGRGESRMTWHSRLVWSPTGGTSKYPDAPYAAPSPPGYDGAEPVAFTNTTRVILGQYRNQSAQDYGWAGWNAGTSGASSWLPCRGSAAVRPSSAVVASPNGRLVVASCALESTAQVSATSLITEQGAAALPGAAAQEVPVGVTDDGLVLTQFSVVRGTKVTSLLSLMPNLPAGTPVEGKHVRADGTLLLLVGQGTGRRYVTVTTQGRV